MRKIMRYISVINRCEEIFRASKLKDSPLCENHPEYVTTICRRPGISQEALAKILNVNKSNITRNLAYLEKCGYVTRSRSDSDRRTSQVYPTDLAYAALPLLTEIRDEWYEYVTSGFSDEEREMFASMLSLAAARAAEFAHLPPEAYGDADLARQSATKNEKSYRDTENEKDENV